MLSSETSFRINHHELGRMIPIDVIVYNKNGRFGFKIEYDESYIQCMEKFPKNGTDTEKDQYERKYLDELLVYHNSICDYIGEYTKLDWDDKNIPEELKDEKTIANYILLHLIPRYDLPDVSSFSANNHIDYIAGGDMTLGDDSSIGLDSKLLTFLLTTKEYIVYRGRIYCNKPIEEFIIYECNVTMLHENGFIDIHMEIYQMGGGCYHGIIYDVEYLRNDIPNRICIDNTNNTFYFSRVFGDNKYKISIPSTIEIIPLYINGKHIGYSSDLDDNIWSNSSEYEKYIDQIKSIIKERNLTYSSDKNISYNTLYKYLIQ